MRMRVAAWVVVAASVAWGGSAREQLVALRARLAAKGSLDRSSGWRSLTSFATAHKAEPALAAEVLYDVALSQQAHSRRDAGRTLETLLDSHPGVQPWAALATLELAKACQERSSTRAKAIELYEKFLALEGQEPGRRAEALFGLAYCNRESGKYQEALEQYRRYLADYPAYERRCAEALAAVGALLVRLKQPQEAFRTYLKLSADYPWDTERRGDLLLSIAQAHRTAEDPEGARAAYERLLKDAPGSNSRRAYAYRGLAMLALQQKDTESAEAIYRRMASDPGLDPSHRVQAYSQLFSLYRDASNFAAMIRLGHELIAAHPTHVATTGKVFDELVEAFISEARIEDALGMAKAHYRLTQLGASSGRSTYEQQAVLTVVRALKAKEGGLRSANGFLDFIAYGPEGPDGKLGTADDLKDPLAQYRLPKDPERERRFAAAERRLGADALQLAYLYVCWDKPAEALAAFRRHYIEHRERSGLQTAASRLARAMRAMGCSETEVGAFFDYQNFGPNGQDGKPKTADDVKDPILERR